MMVPESKTRLVMKRWQQKNDSEEIGVAKPSSVGPFCIGDFLPLNTKFSQQGMGSLKHWLLALGMSSLITIMITPSLNLAPVRYTEGDIITETIILNDDITLIDTRSTNLRKKQVIKDFPPVYDYDSRTSGEVLRRVKTAFSAMRQVLNKQRQQREEHLERVRKNSLAQVKTLSEIQSENKRSTTLKSEIRWIVGGLGEMEDNSLLNAAEKIGKEKWLLDLKTLNTMLQVNKQAKELLNKRLADVTADGRQLAKHTPATNNPKENITQMHAQFNALLGHSVSKVYFGILRHAHFSQTMEEKIVVLLAPLKTWRISSAQVLKKIPKTLQLRDLTDGKIQRWERLEGLLSLDAAREKLRELGARNCLV